MKPGLIPLICGGFYELTNLKNVDEDDSFSRICQIITGCGWQPVCIYTFSQPHQQQQKAKHSRRIVKRFFSEWK